MIEQAYIDTLSASEKNTDLDKAVPLENELNKAEENLQEWRDKLEQLRMRSKAFYRVLSLVTKEPMKRDEEFE